ncbi:ME53 [Hemileuca sp. nucleopolyhedrovirus]|uniref:ME53 n=1 Tax=Hemileuca sp. nucleopolyhedrovirus TaxID=1367203 RepID=S5N338_9ABAC|nr:ME53 [Hemileuca sp. nucleopolyhedrovirus]AGR56760.1 ME53 [Hemileuca sp. nucleopolyhedrovirus]
MADNYFNDKNDYYYLKLKPPHDLRPYFLNHEMLRVMNSIMNFSSNYVKGKYKLNDLSLAKCDDLKRVKEYVYDAKCDKCKRRFESSPTARLYCLIYKKNLIETPSNCHNKYKLICGTCTDELHKINNSMLQTFQLYPKLTMETVKELCKYDFVTKYLFHIDFNNCRRVTETFQDKINNVYETFTTIIKNKRSNERIVKISLLTYEKTLFEENSDGCFMVHKRIVGGDDSIGTKNVLQFDQEICNMLDFIERHRFVALTYFYQVEKEIYHEDGGGDYIVYFSKPFSGYNNRLNCERCKKKFFKNNRNNIILFCSKCGFMNRMHFNTALDNIDLSTIRFAPECVKRVKNKLYCIIYYDLNSTKLRSF